MAIESTSIIKLDSTDYKQIKAECERKINLFEAKLSTCSDAIGNIEPILDKALYNLAHVDERYENSDIHCKRNIIGSMFVGKLEFENGAYRTAKVNEAVALIYSIDEAFKEIEKGQASNNGSLYQKVNLLGLESKIPGAKHR